MVALLSLILKMTIPAKKLTPEWLRIVDSKINRFDVDGGVEHVKKLKKTSKSWNLANSRKKLSKSENSTNFDTTKAGPKFLTLDAKTVFNRLRLTFT